MLRLVNMIVPSFNVYSATIDSCPVDGPTDTTDYIHSVQSSASSIFTTTSSNSINLFSLQASLPLFRTYTNQFTSPITSLVPHSTDPSIFFASEQCGNVKVFDSRAPQNSAQLIVSSSSEDGEIHSMDVGYSGTLVATGGNYAVSFFDIRNGGGSGGSGGSGGNINKATRIGYYEESHTDIITQTRFHPTKDNVVATGGEDCLVCIFDVTRSTEEEAVQSILNVEHPVRRIYFFGPSYEGLFSLSGSETMSLWHPESAQRIADHTSIRETFQVDYLIDAEWSDNQLSLLSGTFSGDVKVNTVSADSVTLAATMANGHSAVCRDFVKRDGCYFTGGEDGKLCVWSTEEGGGKYSKADVGVGVSGKKKRDKKKGGKGAAGFSPY